jgi:hypothetical protein
MSAGWFKTLFGKPYGPNARYLLEGIKGYPDGVTAFDLHRRVRNSMSPIVFHSLIDDLFKANVITIDENDVIRAVS